jgi:transglutaminase-like putative cysteine protease
MIVPSAFQLICRTLGLAIACFLAQPAVAQRAYQAPVNIDRIFLSYQVRADGSYALRVESSIRINTPSAAEDYGSRSIDYISSQEEIRSIEAWTTTPEGVRIPVQPSAIRDREEDNSGSASEFSDSRSKVIVYPKVLVGSVLSYKVETNVHTPPYPGEFQFTSYFSERYPFLDKEIVITIPESRKLYIEKKGVSGGLEKTVEGIAHYRFFYKRDSAFSPESDAVEPIHYADFLAVSTMPDMQALGRVSKSFFAPKVVVTDEIRALALQLTEKIPNAGPRREREKVRVLYEWVARNIRYVSIALGNGRLAPNLASDILHNRYGDCKDHVVLLEALLAAVGIPSSPALISSDRSYKFFGIGVHDPLDHVITYVPSLDLYLDSTDRFAVFGSLPVSDLDKAVVLLNLDKLGRTPRMRAADHTSMATVTMRIQADGRIEGSARTKSTGQYENIDRSRSFVDSAKPEEAVVKNWLFRFNESGAGNFMPVGDPQDLSQPFGMQTRFTLDAVSNFPGRGALMVPVGLSPGRIAWSGSDKPAAKVRYPSVCRSRTLEERIQLVFPENVRIDEIPKGTEYRRGAIRYRSTFSQSGQTVNVVRKLLVERAAPLCGMKEHQEWLDFYKVLQRDLRAQIFYR